MKNISIILFFAVFLFSCAKDSCTTKYTYVKYEPVYKSTTEIRHAISMGAPEALVNPGKIYMFRSYLLVNEQFKGIHFIDNSNPSQPVRVGFLKIVGNLDMAVKGNVLYADNYIDLVSIDLSLPMQPQLVDRDMNVFPNYGTDDAGNILVAYVEKEVTEDVLCSQVGSGWGAPINQGGPFLAMSSQGAASMSTGSQGRSDASVGVGGSMARFTINGDYLYTVDQTNLHSFDISNTLNPTETSNVNVSWSAIETIFPYQDKLFIGGNAGMFIFSVSNPSQPVQLSEFQHANACDPVFVEGNRAYVTLRSGNSCQNFTNQLDVVDISDINNPTLLVSHPMSNPHGLSIKNQKLYLCDGDAGLKIFDSSDDFQIANRLLFQDASYSTYDVIASPFQDLLLVVGKDGLTQYDIQNPSQAVKLSTIPVQR